MSPLTTINGSIHPPTYSYTPLLNPPACNIRHKSFPGRPCFHRDQQDVLHPRRPGKTFAPSERTDRMMHGCMVIWWMHGRMAWMDELMHAWVGRVTHGFWIARVVQMEFVSRMFVSPGWFFIFVSNFLKDVKRIFRSGHDGTWTVGLQILQDHRRPGWIHASPWKMSN